MSNARKIITAKNLKNEEINFQIDKRGNGSLYELGKGGNGIVFRGSLDLIAKPAAIKKIQLNIDISSGEYKHKIIKIAKAVESSYFISSVFTNCNPLFNCFYGLVSHPSKRKAFSSPVLFPQIKESAFYVSEELDKNEIYMIYEYVTGRDLADIIHDKKNSTDDINYRKYGLMLLEAMANLTKVEISIIGIPQKKNIAFVHLDIKPQNIRIDEDDNLKIIDLNTLCAPNDVANSQCYRHSMTFEYSGPEAYDTNTKQSLLASDVFAVGLTLYEMIMKKPGIYFEESSILVWKDFWREKTEKGEELDLDFSPDKAKWATLIKAMTKRDYKERIKMSEALANFKTILSSEEGVGAVLLEGGRVSRRIRRKKRRYSRKV